MRFTCHHNEKTLSTLLLLLLRRVFRQCFACQAMDSLKAAQLADVRVMVVAGGNEVDCDNGRELEDYVNLRRSGS